MEFRNVYQAFNVYIVLRSARGGPYYWTQLAMSPLDVPPAPLPGGTLAELPMLRPCAKLGILANEGIWVVPHLERI